MKELFLRWARYNLNVNAELLGILASRPEAWRREFPTYYKTTLGILSHVIKSDIKWLSRLGAIDEAERARLDRLELDPDSLPALRADIDCRIIALVESSSGFEDEVELDFGGAKRRYRRWEWMQTWFNHQTHHRGNVSVLLDLAGVDNDYSGMVGRSSKAGA
jgi:uncharacterized damage-inducible protein DinB